MAREGITSETDLSTLERWDDRAPAHRVYIYDLETRQEVTDHPCSGMPVLRGNGMASWQGRYCDKTTLGCEGVIWVGGTARLARIDAGSFPGRKIALKHWAPGEDDERDIVWVVLARGDGSRPSAKQARNRRGREWIDGWKAGRYS